MFTCEGGTVELPGIILVDRMDGGHLVVHPPRDVWERSELTAQELVAWSALVAATGRAMIDSLPQLADGCVNYWEAGNWSLHFDAEPRGAKIPRQARHVHLHVLGRSRFSPSWGEAPSFPRFADRLEWAASNHPLEHAECMAVVDRLEWLLREKYSLRPLR